MRIQKPTPHSLQTTQQTVYQHESQIAVWLLVLEDSFMVINANPTVWSSCLDQYFHFEVMSPITSRCHFSRGLTCVAVRSGPAFQTGLVSIEVARVMPEEFIPRPTKLVAAKAVVVLVTANPDLVLKLGHEAIVSQLLPMQAGVDHARMRCFLNQLPICT